jgi:hypothetical protein
VKLVFKSTAPEYVRATEAILLVNSGKTINVFVDCSLLGEGHHTAQIQAYIQHFEHLGPVFHIPITIVKPVNIDALLYRLQSNMNGSSHNNITIYSEKEDNHTGVHNSDDIETKTNNTILTSDSFVMTSMQGAMGEMEGAMGRKEITTTSVYNLYPQASIVSPCCPPPIANFVSNVNSTMMDLGSIILTPAERVRKFIEPPMGCSYIELVIEDKRDTYSPIQQINNDGETMIVKGNGEVSSTPLKSTDQGISPGTATPTPSQQTGQKAGATTPLQAALFSKKDSLPEAVSPLRIQEDMQESSNRMIVATALQVRGFSLYSTDFTYFEDVY